MNKPYMARDCAMYGNSIKMATPQDIDNPYIPEFEKYLRTSEPSVRERADYWRTAIGLQAVDQLTVSDFLKQTAQEHIEGQINTEEAEERIKAYYQAKEVRLPDDDEKEEADKISCRFLPQFTVKRTNAAS